MDTLELLFSSRVKAAVLRLLMRSDAEPFYVRELARRVSFSFSAVQRELKKLCEAGILYETEDGNRVYVAANKEHPIYPELVSLVRKADGVGVTLARLLADQRIDFAFLFGSFASQSERAGSDIDLIVIGDIGLREIVGMLATASRLLGREINPHSFTPLEWQARRARGDHFVNSVMNQPRDFLVGDNDEFERMAK